MNKQEFIKKYDMKELTEADGVSIDIVYATPNNFTGKVVYEEPICMLRKGTAQKLLQANEELIKLGYRIKILDTFRPVRFQKMFWDIYPDERFISNPYKGYGFHTRGNAIDCTLCTLDGKEVKMPTEFDHFGIESYRNYYNKLDDETRNNVLLLENTMKKYGFDLLATEWWHFNDTESYDIIYEDFECFKPILT